MAKYNLLDDDDIFDDNDDLLKDDSDDDVSDLLEEQPEEVAPSEEARGEKELEVQEEKEGDDPFDIDIDEDLLNYEPAEDIDESTFSQDVDLDISSEEEPLEPEISIDPDVKAEEETPAETEEKPAPRAIPDLDIEDDKQEGISYKPIVMGISIVIVLILLYVGVDYFFLSGDSATADAGQTTETTGEAPAEANKKPAKSAADLERERKEKEKQAYLQTIGAENRARIASVDQIVSATGRSARLSSVLLYDQSLTFEVFSKNREELARYNIELKRKGSPFKIVSSSSRPGKNGGILGVFKVEKSSSAGGGQSTAGGKTFASIKELQGWLSGQAKSAGLRVIKLKNRADSGNSNALFKAYRVEAEMSGSLAAAQKMLAALRGASQIKIYKLVETAKDQQNFTGNNYRIQLILQAFI